MTKGAPTGKGNFLVRKDALHRESIQEKKALEGKEALQEKWGL